MKKEREAQKEKKITSKQKIALERIYRLFELAEEKENSKYSKRYVSLAIKIGKRMNVTLPKELKEKFCKECYSVNVEGKAEKPFFVLECKDCKFTKKFELENNK